MFSSLLSVVELDNLPVLLWELITNSSLSLGILNPQKPVLLSVLFVFLNFLSVCVLTPTSLDIISGTLSPENSILLLVNV